MGSTDDSALRDRRACSSTAALSDFARARRFPLRVRSCQNSCLPMKLRGRHAFALAGSHFCASVSKTRQTMCNSSSSARCCCNYLRRCIMAGSRSISCSLRRRRPPPPPPVPAPPYLPTLKRQLPSGNYRHRLWLSLRARVSSSILPPSWRALLFNFRMNSAEFDLPVRLRPWR